MNNIFEYKTIGFDLDGTLYDEFDFIKEAYKSISLYVSDIVKHSQSDVYNIICSLWLKFGSSKKDLFQTFFKEFGFKPSDKHINECLNFYRNTQPNLLLPARCRFLLNVINKENQDIFIFTDGNKVLQRKKIEALKLDQWFKKEKVFVSGDYGREYQKPETNILNRLKEAICLDNVLVM